MVAAHDAGRVDWVAPAGLLDRTRARGRGFHLPDRRNDVSRGGLINVPVDEERSAGDEVG